MLFSRNIRKVEKSKKFSLDFDLENQLKASIAKDSYRLIYIRNSYDYMKRKKSLKK